MYGDSLPILETESSKIYSEVNKLYKNSSLSFHSIERSREDPFYMFCFLLGANPQASEQLNYRRHIN